MSFDKINPSGWAFEDILTSNQMNEFQDDLIQAVDGYGGGSYPNASEIEFQGDFKVGNDLTVNGDTTLGNNSGVDVVTLNSACIVQGTLTANNTTNLVGNATGIGTNSGQALTVFASSTFWSPINTKALITAQGQATFTDVVTMNDNVTIGVNGTDLLTVNASSVYKALASFEGNVAIGNASSDTLTVVSNATFTSTVNLNGNTVIGNSTGDIVTIGGTTTIDGPVTCNGIITLNGDATVGNLTIQGDTIVGNATSDTCTFTARISGTPTVSGVLSWAGNGRNLEKGYLLPDSDATISVRQYNRFVATAATITGARTYTLDDGSSLDGDWFSVINLDGTYDLILSSSKFAVGGPNLHITPLKFAQFIMIGGSWYTALAT